MEQIDWPGIQANSVHMGIRGAARAAARNLTPEEQDRFVERVMKRASREGWEEQRLSAVASATAQVAGRDTGRAAMPLSADVRNGADAASIAQADHSRRSRSAGLEYAALTTEYAAKQAKSKPGEALELAQLVKSSLQGAAIAGDWQTVQPQGPAVVNIQLIGMHLPDTEQARVVDLPVELALVQDSHQ